MRTAAKKTLSLALAMLLAFGTLPQTVLAVSESEGGTITAFEPLEDSVANQTVFLGTTFENLNLPDTLTAAVEITQPEVPDDNVQDSGEPAQEDEADPADTNKADPSEADADEADSDDMGSDETDMDGKAPATPSDAQKPAGEDNEPSESPSDTGGNGVSQITMPVPVAWAARPDYDGDSAGIYTFTAEIEGFTLAVGVQPPQITVTVGEAAGGVITAFAELDGDIRFQRGDTPDLPDTLEATVGGETVTVPVTWESETDATQKGLHVFVATPGEGYSLASGVKNPVLSFYRTAGAPRIVARMAGSGNTGDELKITTAAQLAEIAALTNAGKLEAMVFGEGATAQVHLKLMNGLDIAGQGDADGWVPIGNLLNPFKGSFDGGGNTITGLTIDRNSSNQGLFGVIGAGGVVSGLGLVKVSVSGNDSVGGAAGAVHTGGTIENCFVAGSVSGSSVVGGVAGGVVGTLTNCYSTGSVSRSGTGGNAAFGGVAGGVYGTVQNCYSTGSVNGTYNVGGVAGSVSSGKVLNCAALNPSVSGSGVGRVVSQNFGGILTGNIAFSGMLGGGSGTSGDINGADKTAAAIAAADFFAGVFDSEVAGTAWTYAPGALPGLFGQTVEMPAHLIDSANPFSGGDGSSAGTAYQITTAAQLAKLAMLVNSNADDTANGGKYATKHYKLMNGLDLTNIDPGSDKTGWVPIGNAIYQFKGTFNGGGNTITGLTISRSADYQGLFGYIGENGAVSGLGLTDVNIDAGNGVGGVAGFVVGTVTNCYSTGNVTGSSFVGGVAGCVIATVQNCYSTGNVNGSWYVGGVAGRVFGGTVQNCYSTGSVTGSDYVGGVAGYVGDSSKVENCMALNPSVTATDGGNVGRVAGIVISNSLTGNIAFNGMTVKNSGGVVSVTTSAGDNKNGEGKAAVDLQTEGGFPAVFRSDPWEYTPGFLPGLFGQPVKMPGHINESGSPFAGQGTVNFPYEIETEYQLARLAELVNASATNEQYGGTNVHYKLMNNLNIAGQGDSGGWVPIGTEDTPFKGQFNGNNKIITGLTIDRSSYYQGLFGYIGENGAVSGLGLVNVSIDASSGGGVAGYVGKGRIESCFVTGSVSGNGYVGGVAGWVAMGEIESCFVTGSVNGGNNVGGVAGWVAQGEIESCFVTGSVSSTSFSGNVGGVAGEVSGTGTVTNCYSTGSVGGGQNVGGVAGWVNGGTVANCYSTGSVSDTGILSRAGGVAGWVGAGRIENCAALNPGVTATNGSNGGRVVGQHSGGTLTGNRAFNSMTVTVQSSPKTLDRGADKLDGADMTATEAIALAFWTTAGNWDTSASPPAPWDTAVWDIQDGELPILRNVGGNQSGESGLYLTPKNAANLTVTVDPASYAYTGSPITPTAVRVEFGTTLLAETTDYALSYSSDTTNVGTVTVTVTGKGSYSGTKTAAFTIDATVPGAPTGLTAATGNGQLALSWTAPASDGGSAITKYQYSASTGADDWQDIPDSGPSTTSYTVTGLANGTTYTVKVRAENSVGSGAEVSITETPFAAVTDVSVSPTSHSLTVGGTVQLNATVSPGNATNQAVSWVSSATAVASVSSSGLVTARAAGTAIITVTTADGGKTAQCTVTVTRAGGSSDSDSDDSSSKPTVTVTPAAQPDWPTIGSVPGKVAGTNTQRTFTITDSLVKAALEKAQADAKAKNRTAYGVGAQIALDAPAAEGLTLTLERAALNRLVSEKAKQFEITGAPISLTFDTQALSELQKQGTGNVTITVKPTTVKGVRNAYDITLTTVKDGKTVSITNLGTGSATLSIPSTPGKNEAAGYLYAVYVDGTGKVNRIADSAYDANRSSVIFSTNHFSVYGVGYTAPSAKFTDIGSHWAKESIDYVVGRGLLSGTSDITFAPDTAMTRGMLVTALGRLAGVDTKAYTTNSFTDVKADSTFRPYIEWAYKKGIIQGIGNSQFAPNRAVTRQEIAVILQNYAKATGYTLPITREATTYADASSIGSAYKTAVKAMQQAGIMMGGTGNRFNPKSSATRAEVSAMLHRYIKLTIDPATAQGWAKNDDGQFLYYKDGKAVTGTQTIDGVKYYFNNNGTLKTGWIKDDTGNWHFYSENILLVGFWDIGANGNNKRYYFDTYGNMISGKWLQIDGKWYYFYADGSLARSTKIDEYEVDENGVRKTK